MHPMPGRAIGRRAIPALVLAFSLGGCALASGGAVPDPNIPLPAQWSEPGSGRASYDDATYWRALNDPVLTELVEEALKNNLDIAQSAARLAQAHENVVQARAALFPQVSASGNATRNIGDGPATLVIAYPAIEVGATRVDVEF